MYFAVKNRLDGRFYAVKKVLLDSWDQKANGKILREVTTLSRLHHQHVVRYFQAWIEGTEQEEIEALLARAQVLQTLVWGVFFLSVLIVRFGTGA